MNAAPIIHDFLCYNIGMETNYAEPLEMALAGWRLELLRLLAYQSAMSRMPLYLVGGVVRDILLERTINDFDLVLVGDSAVFAKYVMQKYGGNVRLYPKFGTATWVVNESTFNRLNIVTHPDSALSFDIVSARSEIYAQPGSLPIVRRATIDEDLRRRDFTINAMAIRLDGSYFGKLTDPLNGRKDLENKLVRVLHSRSFVEDPTRMFRAVRYAVRYRFEIEPETLSLINDEARGVMAQLSGERLRHELDLVFEEAPAGAMLKNLKELGLLNEIHPALQIGDNGWLSALTDKPEEVFAEFSLPGILSFKQVLGWVLYLMNLSASDIEAVAHRLTFPTVLTKTVTGASALNSGLVSAKDWKPSQWTFYLDQFPPLAVYAVYLVKFWSDLQDYFMIWRHIKPFTTGYTLQQLGLEPGPRFAEILRQLRTAWLDGEVATEDEEKKLLEELIR